MTLKRGSSPKTISANVDEMIKSWKRTGKIGNAHPPTLAKAQEMATAAAYSKARGSKKRAKRKKK